MSGDTHPVTEASPAPADVDAVAAEEAAAQGSAAPAEAPSPAEEGAPLEGEGRVRELEQQLAALQAECDGLRSQYMRIAADFDNFRKRQSRDQ
ncbi:MAG: nucleotide exchange factor GrpE, partial [Synechococcus sp.]